MTKKKNNHTPEENIQQNKEIKVVRLTNYISYQLLAEMKKKEPTTKFILPNGKEAILNGKEK